MNLYDNFKETIEEKVKDKLLMLERQKVCIAKYKKLQKYFETVDFDNIDPKEQYRLLTAYDYCQIGKVDENLRPSNLSSCSNVEPILNDLTPFDTTKLVNTLMGRQDCKQTYIWLDRGYKEITEDWYLKPYSGEWDDQWEKRSSEKFSYARVKIVCPPDFDDEKTYSEQEISNLVKTKKIFFLSYEVISENFPIGFFDYANSEIVFDQIPYDRRTLDTFCFVDNNVDKNYQSKTIKRQNYINQIQQIYPNFASVYLKQLADELPKEISARIRQAKQTHKQIKTFIEESYAEYRIALEKELQKVESDRQKQLDEVKTEPKYDESKFEF